jgi:drug/metabolite transporter (DMT)-like permease
VFASAPFVAAALSLWLLGEQVTSLQIVAATLFLISVGRLLASQHEHTHRTVRWITSTPTRTTTAITCMRAPSP